MPSPKQEPPAETPQWPSWAVAAQIEAALSWGGGGDLTFSFCAVASAMAIHACGVWGVSTILDGALAASLALVLTNDARADGGSLALAIKAAEAADSTPLRTCMCTQARRQLGQGRSTTGRRRPHYGTFPFDRARPTQRGQPY